MAHFFGLENILDYHPFVVYSWKVGNYERAYLSVSNMQTQDEFIKQLLWRCRRGMLELDMLLMPFCVKYYPSLSPQEKCNFENLLACEDTELLAWFTGGSIPADPHLKSVIKLIQDHVSYSP